MFIASSGVGPTSGESQVAISGSSAAVLRSSIASQVIAALEGLEITDGAGLCMLIVARAEAEPTVEIGACEITPGSGADATAWNTSLANLDDVVAQVADIMVSTSAKLTFTKSTDAYTWIDGVKQTIP